MPEITLQTDSGEYTGWKAVRIRRSLDQITNTFSLSVSDAGFSQFKRHPLQLDSSCRVLIDGLPVINGFVDTIKPSIAGNNHSLEIAGRDVTGDLVDCSAQIPNQELHNVNIKDAAGLLCAEYGVTINCPEPGEPFEKFVVNDGETVFSCIEAHARQRSLFPYTLGDAVLHLKKPQPHYIGDSLIEGLNILEASAEHSNRNRFHKIITKSQQAGAPSEADEFIDEQVRAPRLRIVRAEKPVNRTICKNRAEWEARLRAARGKKANITVQGWYTPISHQLWDVTQTLKVESERLGLNEMMMINAVDYEAGDAGTLAHLNMIPPEAYTYA